ncbi:MAG TPA: response regulator [Candidatus Saccharimonadales bacterium]|jgi:two-component system sensor histidine kinase/response regulator|nr:response regulator [Candidatus Saccharimonadales bacterium]
MQWSRKLSLRRKLTLVIMVNTFIALCVAAVGFAEYGVYQLKQARLEDLNALANMMGTNSTAPLTFKDAQAAEDILSALTAKPHIISAAIYDREGSTFAVYVRSGEKDQYSAPVLNGDSSRFTSDRVLIFQSIIFEGEKVGTIFLEGDTVEYNQLLRKYLRLFGIIIAMVSLGAYLMAGRLQRPISNPILQLAWTTKMVTSSRDYSIRAMKYSEDEVGVLIDGFNEMLQQIQTRDGELMHAREDLEKRVDERTSELELEMSDRQRAQEALHESEAQIRLLMDSTAEAIFGIDLDGIITFANSAALRLLRYEQIDSILGKSAHHLMHHSYSDGTPYPIQECQIVHSRLQGIDVHLDSEVFWRADGTSFPVEYWAYPIRKEDELVGAVITFLDITERKRAQAALVEAKQAAEAASQAKSEFLANMSHEIRTPMNGIIGMTDLALETYLTAEQREYLNLVKSSADSLLHVINDILDFSKIEAGKLELESTDFAIRDLFRDTLKALAQRTENKPLEICERVSPKVPVNLVGDPTRLRQLVVNLVGNSIKFTEQGSIVLNADLESAKDDEVVLHISVSDTGMGIPKEKQGIIFDSFAQADGSTTRRFGGTGLGLTISRQLVELMGGKIWVESEMGKGSTFHFTCHLMKGKESASDDDRIAAKTLPGINVLVAESNEVNREIFSEMLKNWGMNSSLANNGRAALDLLESARKDGHPFRLAILDTEISDMDGFEIVQQMQSNPELNCEVIMLVNLKRHFADMEQCRALGVKHFLTKPIGQSELLDSILSAVTEKVAVEQIVKVSVSDLAKPASRQLNILLSEDNAVNQKLAIRLLEKAGHHVTLARTGREAVTAWENSGEPGFDVLLMDIQMPEMDGMEATAEIRSREKKSGKHVPILAMTAHAMRGDRERCLENGMDGYISKPIHPVDLFAEIERCLGLQKGNNPMPENSQKMQELIDRASLLERVEGDHELLGEMIQIFMEEAPALMDAMRESLRIGDMAVLERSAHSLKGAVSNLSSKATAAAALKLEHDAKENNAQSAKESLAAVEEIMKLLLPALSELIQGVSK